MLSIADNHSRRSDFPSNIVEHRLHVCCKESFRQIMSGKLADSESWEVEVEEMLTEYRQGQTRVKCTNKCVSS